MLQQCKTVWQPHRQLTTRTVVATEGDAFQTNKFRFSSKSDNRSMMTSRIYRTLHLQVDPTPVDMLRLTINEISEVSLFTFTVAVLHFCNWGGSRGGIGCDRGGTKRFYPLTPTVAILVNPVPDRVKPSFVIFDIRALCRLKLSVRVPGCQKLQMTA